MEKIQTFRFKCESLGHADTLPLTLEGARVLGVCVYRNYDKDKDWEQTERGEVAFVFNDDTAQTVPVVPLFVQELSDKEQKFTPLDINLDYSTVFMAYSNHTQKSFEPIIKNELIVSFLTV